MGSTEQGTVATALAHATRLLSKDPASAERQLREVLKVCPGNPDVLVLLARALRGQARPAATVAELAVLDGKIFDASLQYELALAYGEAGESNKSVGILRRLLRHAPDHPEAWRALGDQLGLLGDSTGSDAAYARHIKASVRNPRLLEAAAALCEDRLAVAERLLRAFLKAQPTDVTAIRMLAEVGTRLGRLDDAEKLLRRCLQLAPGFAEARHNYAIVLHRQNKPVEAVAELEVLLRNDSRNPNYRALKAAALGRIGDYEQAIEIYERLLREYPDQHKAWMSYGHALKTIGRTAEAVAAYRRSIALMPNLGEAYWSLANLKTFRFTADDKLAMEAQLARGDLEEEDRVHLNFALGKALEDEGAFAAAFCAYERGNALRKRVSRYQAGEITQMVERSTRLFTSGFFSERTGFGSKAADPIFVVGLTRSGSTLIDQILSSHSAVEGTMELPDLLSLARRFGPRVGDKEALYPLGIEHLGPEEALQLGEEYLRRTHVHRKLKRPFFIDKLPNNWTNIGLIQLILPNAKIVDARRHPLACCFSNYKQLFARGQGFSYDLRDCAQYYRDYVHLMQHFDDVLPGRIHRVLYEHLIGDPEAEIERLLQYCGLPFERQCMAFYENARAVRTASSEQVRRPLYTEGLEQWKNFEDWLRPLKEVLGDTLQNYPGTSLAVNRPDW